MKGFLKGVGLLGLMLVCCAFLLAGCGEEKADTIKIGFNLPLTGDIPEVGEGSKNAAEMYLKDINEAGGSKSAARSTRSSSSTWTTSPRLNPQPTSH